MTKVHVVNEPNRGRSYDLERDSIRVGRSSDNDIRVKDKFVSRQHLQILRKGNRYFIKDLNSTNGTFVNGRQIRPGSEFQIKEGLPIAIGMSVICVGENCPQDVQAFLDSIGISKQMGRKVRKSKGGRRLTPQKNMEFIYQVSNVLMESLNLNDIAEKIMDYIFNLLKRIDRGVIILVDHKTKKISGVFPRIRRPEAKSPTLFSQEVVYQVMGEGKPAMIFNALAQDESSPLRALEPLKIGSVLCVPLISRSRILGVIYVDSVEAPYGFREDDLSLLSAFSSRAALALENALLYANLEKRGEEKRKNLEKGQGERFEETELATDATYDNMTSGEINIT